MAAVVLFPRHRRPVPRVTRPEHYLLVVPPCATFERIDQPGTASSAGELGDPSPTRLPVAFERHQLHVARRASRFPDHACSHLPLPSARYGSVVLVVEGE